MNKPLNYKRKVAMQYLGAFSLIALMLFAMALAGAIEGGV